MNGRSVWQAEIASAAECLRCADVASPEYDARELACAAVERSAAVVASAADGRAAAGVTAGAGVNAVAGVSTVAEVNAGTAASTAVSAADFSRKQPTPQQLEIFWHFIQRRAEREPLQHITERMYFRYLELEAQPGVFIVRPETEMVAQAGIDFLAEYDSGIANHHAANHSGANHSVVNYRAASNAPRIAAHNGTENAVNAAGTADSALHTALNAGTASAAHSISGKEPIIAVELFSGSGAIALSIATELRERISNLEVYAIEMSAEAYESSQRNNARYGNAVNFICADALAPLPEHLAARIEGKAALVIANPPYVPPYHELSPEVRADPALALFGGGEEGLDIPLAAIRRAADVLAPGGALVMEHASEQAAALRAAAARAGFAGARTGKDLAGAERWLFARWPHAL